MAALNDYHGGGGGGARGHRCAELLIAQGKTAGLGIAQAPGCGRRCDDLGISGYYPTDNRGGEQTHY